MKAFNTPNAILVLFCGLVSAVTPVDTMPGTMISGMHITEHTKSHTETHNKSYTASPHHTKSLTTSAYPTIFTHHTQSVKVRGKEHPWSSSTHTWPKKPKHSMSVHSWHSVQAREDDHPTSPIPHPREYNGSLTHNHPTSARRSHSKEASTSHATRMDKYTPLHIIDSRSETYTKHAGSYTVSDYQHHTTPVMVRNDQYPTANVSIDYTSRPFRTWSTHSHSYSDKPTRTVDTHSPHTPTHTTSIVARDDQHPTTSVDSIHLSSIPKPAWSTRSYHYTHVHSIPVYERDDQSLTPSNYPRVTWPTHSHSHSHSHTRSGTPTHIHTVSDTTPDYVVDIHTVPLHGDTMIHPTSSANNQGAPIFTAGGTNDWPSTMLTLTKSTSA